MTCIVGLIESGTVWLGADSCVTAGNSRYILPPDDTKLFTIKVPIIGGPNEKMLFGYAGSVRSCQIVKYNLSLEPLDIEEKSDNMKYIMNHVIPNIKKIAKSNGVLKSESNVETADAWFILGWRGKLYYIGGDFSILSVTEPYAADGSGAEVAIGSLKSNVNSPITPEEKLKAALDAAEKHTSFVEGPFYFISDGVSNPTHSVASSAPKDIPNDPQLLLG